MMIEDVLSRSSVIFEVASSVVDRSPYSPGKTDQQGEKHRNLSDAIPRQSFEGGERDQGHGFERKIRVASEGI
jgi:hypothetical protein